MTLLAFHGFEGYADPYDQRDASDFITSISRDNGMVYSTGRNTGGKSLKYNNDSFSTCIMQFGIPVIDDSREIIFGFAIKFGGYPIADTIIFGLSESTNVFSGLKGTLYSNGNLRLAIMNYNTSVAYYDFLPNLDTWYYIETKIRVHDTLGIGIIKVDEQEVVNFSGDTKSGLVSSDIDYLKFVFPHNCFIELDDIYLADNQGSDINDFLGDIRIDAIHPNGAGNHTDLTPSAGANYECIDETTMDDSDYVEGINAGDKDSYSYAAVPTDLDDSGIIGLQIKNNCKRTAAATNIKIDPFIRTGSTDYSQTVQDLPDAIGIVSGDIILDDPSDSNPWTQAKINACEFGMEVA